MGTPSDKVILNTSIEPKAGSSPVLKTPFDAKKGAEIQSNTPLLTAFTGANAVATKATDAGASLGESAAAEAKRSTDVPFSAEAPQKFEVFISTANADKADANLGAGDYDYAKTLADGANLFSRNKAHYIRGLFSEQEVYEFVDKHRSNTQPVLHILINPPCTGMAFTPPGLNQFKKNGGKVVVTAVEFHKYGGRYSEEKSKMQILTILKCADEIVFLDDLDKIATLKGQAERFSTDEDLKKKLLDSHVIAVPPTILPQHTDPNKRDRNIITFTMIRTGKGYAHVIKLAELIRNSTDARIKDKKVLVVGTVLDKFSHQLARLMESVYKSKHTEIQKHATNKIELIKLLTQCKQEEADGKMKADLPLEIHVDVPEAALTPLFARCTYSYLPMYRGSTLRNSSFASSFAQKFITYSHIDDITPSQIKPGGEHAGAMVLMENDKYANYADAVFTDIVNRETDAKLNADTRGKIDRLMREVLSRERVIAQHAEIYAKLLPTLTGTISTPEAFAKANKPFTP